MAYKEFKKGGMEMPQSSSKLLLETIILQRMKLFQLTRIYVT